jgi:hypothetical protein
MQLHALQLTKQTGESIGASSPYECFPEHCLAVRKPNLEPIMSLALCLRQKASFGRHIILPRFVLSRERNEACTLP